jgi:hypothetical protein
MSEEINRGPDLGDKLFGSSRFRNPTSELGQHYTSSDTISTQFVTNLLSIMEEAEALLLSKHKDYGPTNIANAPGGALNGLRVRIHDKIARINHLIDSGKDPQHESLRDSFIDLLNYSAIAIMVLENKWPNG